jgi:hypothetical protein
MSDQRAYDMRANGPRGAEEEANVGAVGHNLERTARRERRKQRERISTGNDPVRDHPVEPAEGS